MNWYIGPWIWDAKRTSWNPPAGFSAFDLRSIELQGKAGGTPGLGLFIGTTALNRDYQLVKDQRRFVESLIAKADPDGQESPRPIMPTTQRRLEFMGSRQRFQWGDRRTNRIRDVLHRQFAERWEGNQSHARKCLDYDCHKLGVKDWRELIPAKLLPHVEGPLPHETTYTENFTRADSGTVIGNLLTWTQVSGTWGTYLNQAYVASMGTGSAAARAESDVSSTDHYVQAVIAPDGLGNSTSFGGPVARFDPSAKTYYIGSNYADQQYISKSVSGTVTNLGNAAHTYATNETYKTYCNGSTIKAYVNGVEIVSLTDSSITTGTRGGIAYDAINKTIDDFEISDLAAGGGVFNPYFYRFISGGSSF